MGDRMRNNLRLLIAQKGNRERRRITLKTVADETGINTHTMYGLANDTLTLYTKDALIRLCAYLGCDIGDLLTIEEEAAS